MPRLRVQRQSICDCLDCTESNAPVPAPAEAQTRKIYSVHSAIAHQEPPPKSVIIIICGAVCASAAGVVSLDQADVPHLDAASRDGCVGLLAVADAPGRAAEEQLLGSAVAEPSPPPPLGSRFMDLRAVLLADQEVVSRAAEQAGFHEAQLLAAGGVRHWPEAGDLARRIVSIVGVQPLNAVRPQPDSLHSGLGLHEGPADGCGGIDSTADMAVLLLHASDAAELARHESGAAAGDSVEMAAACQALQWADTLVRHLNAAPGFRETVLLTVVLGPGRRPLPLLLPTEQAVLQPASLSESGAGAGADSSAAGLDFPPLLRPLQSFQFSGMQAVTVDAGRPAVVVHRLPGVIRRDAVQALDLRDIWRRGGGGCILAERLLPEIAYKLGRAPKYGA